jgi:hypothetical protein
MPAPSYLRSVVGLPPRNVPVLRPPRIPAWGPPVEQDFPGSGEAQVSEVGPVPEVKSNAQARPRPRTSETSESAVIRQCTPAIEPLAFVAKRVATRPRPEQAQNLAQSPQAADAVLETPRYVPPVSNPGLASTPHVHGEPHRSHPAEHANPNPRDPAFKPTIAGASQTADFTPPSADGVLPAMPRMRRTAAGGFQAPAVGVDHPISTNMPPPLQAFASFARSAAASQPAGIAPPAAQRLASFERSTAAAQPPSSASTSGPRPAPNLPPETDRPPIEGYVKSKVPERNTIHIGRVDVQITPPAAPTRPPAPPVQPVSTGALARGFTSWFGFRQG